MKSFEVIYPRNKMACLILAPVLFAAVLLAASPQSARAQAVPSSPQKAPPCFTLSASVFGDEETPPIYYLEQKFDAAGKMSADYRELTVAKNAMGPRTQVQLIKPVRLFTMRKDPAGKPVYEPLLEIPAKSQSDDLLLIAYRDLAEKMAFKFVDNSAGAHPAGTVRMINLSGTPAAFSVGGPPAPVFPGNDAVLRPVPRADGQFAFVQSEVAPGGKVYEAPTKLIQFRSAAHRLLVVFALVPFEEASGQEGADGRPSSSRQFRPAALRVPDTLPAEKKNTAAVVNPVPESVSFCQS